MGRVQLAIVCAIPVLTILFIQIAYRKHNEPSDISGCYSASDATFEVRNGSLLTAGKPIATAHLQYFKQQPYLAVDPGIDIIGSPARLVTKERGFPENYPMVIKPGQMEVIITSTDNLQHTFIHHSCGGS
ncbi:hypothetical protein [Sphingomonas sp. YR710]|uniref:hypothetical protein n=1 Tax=Sphingomonas sp. YR710 TaxID=1882773 RepID=UPI000B82A1E9|nr:hypothetical protein [Sphingomonas sp. YR710]